jgi:hypothetical protein
MRSNTTDGPAGPPTLSITEEAISSDKSQGDWVSAFGTNRAWRLRAQQCPLLGVKRTSGKSLRMSAYDGVFNRSTQHLLILPEEEVCDGGDCTDMVHAAAEG